MVLINFYHTYICLGFNILLFSYQNVVYVIVILSLEAALKSPWVERWECICMNKTQLMVDLADTELCV